MSTCTENEKQKTLAVYIDMARQMVENPNTNRRARNFARGILKFYEDKGYLTTNQKFAIDKFWERL